MQHSVCNRCGAHLTRTFRVGDFVFGSECISKVDESLMRSLYGERLDLATAIHQWAMRILRSRARGTPKELVINPSEIPEVGAMIRNGSGFPYTVVGYTSKGIRVSGTMPDGRGFLNDIEFNQVHNGVITYARGKGDRHVT